MDQLFFIKKGKLEWRDSKSPKIENGIEALVRPFAVAKCDLDDLYLFNNVSSSRLKMAAFFGKLDPGFARTFGYNMFTGPFPFGHECVAEIIEVGDKVKNLSIGDVVSVPFQISCGKCNHCNQGLTASCVTVSPISTYGFGKHLQFGGAMSDLIKIPFAEAMLIKIPKEIDPIHLASLSDNVPDAYRAVAPYLIENNQKSILIIGGRPRSIGLYCVLIAKALGASNINYLDKDLNNLLLAKKLGANNTYDSFESVNSRYDHVIEASSSSKGLNFAMKNVTNYGTCVSIGIYPTKTNMPLVEMYTNGITFVTGLTNAKDEAIKVLELIKNTKLDLSLVTTTHASWDNAIDAFLSKSCKVIVSRDRKFL